MAKGLRIILKVIFLGLVVAGCVLLGISAIRGGMGRDSTAEQVAPAAADSGQPAGKEPQRKGDEGQPFWLKSFEHPVYDGSSESPQAVITGKEALWWGAQKKIWEIFAPVITFSARGSGGDEVDVDAERATLRAGEGVVYLYEKVRVKAEDFDIFTSNLTYVASKRRLESDADITLRKYRIDSEGHRTPSMEVTGNKFSVDIALRKVVIHEDPAARFLDVSEDFLSGGGKEEAPRGRPVDVVITCSGTLIYEHPARKATFTKGVRVTFGEKTLNCEQLVLSIGEEDEKGRVGITDITASGKVEFRSHDQVARGEELKWRIVTQACLLTGEGSMVRTGKLTIAGERLTLFRLNSRFQVDGPGSLLWQAAEQKDETPGQEGESAPVEGKPDLQIIAFREDQPVEITWAGSMTYDRAERLALFKEAVRAHQEKSSLCAEMLKIVFRQEDGQISEVTAQGNVELSQPGQGDEQRRSLCERVEWKAAEGTVTLLAAEEETVEVLTGGQRLVSREIVFHTQQNKLQCPAPGSITFLPAEKGRKEEAIGATRVQWQESMEFERGANPTAVFKGNTQAFRDRQKISSGVLEVNFDAEMNLLSIVASDNAVLRVKPREAAGKSQGRAESTGNKSDQTPGAEEESLNLPQFGQGDSAWQLKCEKFVIEVARDSVYCARPGVIEVLGESGVKEYIRWAKKMRLGGRDTSAYFEGNVEARVKGSVLLSDKLTVDFNEEGQLRHTKAEGEVHFSTLKKDSWQLECGSAEAIFVDPGRLQQLIAREEVRVIDAERRLRCELLHLFFEDTGVEKEPALIRAVARNDVSVVYDTSLGTEGSCDQLSWDRTTDTYVLRGEPHAELRQDELLVRNETIRVVRSTGKMILPEGGKPAEMQVRSEGQ